MLASVQKKRKVLCMGCGALLLSLALAGCGFQLRGSAVDVQWPAALARLQLKLETSGNMVFERTLRDELVQVYGVALVEKDAPVLTVSGVSQPRKVLSLSSTGKASEYLLRFDSGFSLVDLKGKQLIASQRFGLQREFTVGTENILAKQAEEQRIYDELQADAARQLLRRVSSQFRGKAG
ncbi:MAG: LPS assembly lipoprotein LptE [Acidiferrobacterales bacterium]|nr:LPS assembly lipoprotein LptE [Acidiferrobacterales bacterium]